jgi:hypothetical protein
MWEGLSDCQLKNLCPTLDGDFRASTAESKQRIPQSFSVHSAKKATFPASAVALMGFGRISEVYYHKCSFSGFFYLLLNLMRFGTLGERGPGAYHWSRKSIILYNNGIFRL